MQQKSLFSARMASNTPIMVRAMFAQEGFHHAKTITNTASMKRQKQNDMVPPFVEYILQEYGTDFSCNVKQKKAYVAPKSPTAVMFTRRCLGRLEIRNYISITLSHCWHGFIYDVATEEDNVPKGKSDARSCDSVYVLLSEVFMTNSLRLTIHNRLISS
jgi:hypothetical protein